MAQIVIDFDDPLLSLFVAQHNFRERYLHALQEIIEKAKDASLTVEQAYEESVAIAMDAVSDEITAEWIDEGMPLPWIDGLYMEQDSAFEQLSRDAREVYLKRLNENPLA